MTYLKWIVFALVLLTGCSSPSTSPAPDSSPSHTVGDRPLARWKDNLSSPDKEKRRQTADALGYLGAEATPAVPLLVRTATDDDDPLTRIAAVRALGRVRPAPQATVPALLRLLKDKSLAVREEAVRSLGRVGHDDSDALAALVATAQRDRDLPTAALAAEAIGRFGARATAAAPVLLELLSSPDSHARAAAAEALGLLQADPDKAVPLLQKKLTDGDRRVEARTVRALGRYGAAARAAAPALQQRIRKGEAAEVGEAVSALRAVDPVAAVGLVDELRRVVTIQRGAPVLEAVAKLALFGGETRSALPDLTRLLRDENAFIRTQAARALRTLGRDAAGSEADLIRALDDVHPTVRSEAATALGRLGASAKSAGPRLSALLSDAEGEVRSAAAFGLWGTSGRRDDALNVLTAALKGRTADARKQAAELLALMGPQAEPALSDLAALLADRASPGREAAAAALGAIAANDAGARALVSVLEDPSPTLRRAAVRALGVMGPAARSALPALTTARSTAWGRLAQLNDETTSEKRERPELVELLEVLDETMTAIESAQG